MVFTLSGSTGVAPALFPHAWSFADERKNPGFSGVF
jgi:hypothetical protein